MTRILHTGDTHLGYRQYHLPERRDDFLAAFRRVIDDAVSDDVDAVVHAGDLFHDRTPTLSDVMGAVSLLRELDAADILFLAIVGNHESKRDTQWLDLFESMGLARRLGDEPTVVGDVALYGLDFVSRSQREDLSYDFEPHDANYAALVSHGLFAPFAHGDWDATEILSESTVEFDALLLGDDHEAKTKRVEEPHAAWLTYCGSTERASTAEREDRGYNIVEFDDGVDIRRRGIETRPFVFVEVDLKPGEGAGRVREQVGQYDLESAVVAVWIRGEGEDVLPATIEEFAADQGALVTRVTDEREQTEERDIEVSFADPDAAVRERLDSMGLSEAARDLDETIRASKVADSNVADTVERRVADLLSEEGDGAFEPADTSAGESQATEDTSQPTEDTSQSAETAETEPDDTAENAAEEGVEDTADDGEQTENDGQATMGEYR
jgi:DNA repair exonuclease SbcCD nuclease subunit